MMKIKGKLTSFEIDRENNLITKGLKLPKELPISINNDY